MPFYTFKCPSCSVKKEVKQSMDAPNPKCEKCDTASLGIHIPTMERVWKSTGKPQFKGKGFYETDYKTKDKP
tara:strand:- start:1304 stop:1519 length:216 start_codon:yes stop_codon:yes gene_type:complete